LALRVNTVIIVVVMTCEMSAYFLVVVVAVFTAVVIVLILNLNLNKTIVYIRLCLPRAAAGESVQVYSLSVTFAWPTMGKQNQKYITY